MQRKKRRKALHRAPGKRASRRVAKPAAPKQRRRKKKKARVKKRALAKSRLKRVTKRPAPKRRVVKRPAAKKRASKKTAAKRRVIKRSAQKRKRAAKRPAKPKAKLRKAKVKAPTRRGSPSPRARQPKRKAPAKKRKGLPKKRKFLPLPPTGLLKEPTGVPLTERERGEIEVQRRLVREEIARLKKLKKVDETRGVFPSEEEIEDMREPEAELREFVEGSIADVIEKDRTERQKRRARRLAMEAVAPQALRDMLTMAREQTYDHRPVTNVRVLKNGWIVGVDAWGRDLRAIALVNTDNGKVRIRWRDVAPLPKRGGYVEDDGYESLKPKRYAVFGVFA